MGKKRQAIKRVEKADIAVSKRTAKMRDAPLVRALDAFGQLGDQPPLIAFALGVAAAGLIRRDPRVVRGGARMLASHLLATAAKAAVKHSVDRTRPKSLVNGGRHELKTGGRDEDRYNSLPSGHTAGAVAVAQAMARDFPGSAGPAHLAAAAIAAAQVPRGNHFVTDTAAGALIGWAAEAAVNALYRFGRQGLPSYS